MDYSATDVRRIYRAMARIRRVEEKIAEIYPSDRIKSPVHLSIGQEAVSVGVIDTLNEDDVVAASYRCHGAYLAKGGDLNAMFAELYGKDTGGARGKGGSMHLVDYPRHFMGASAVVGTHIPVAVGHALAAKKEDRGRIVVVFFGDGAVEEGVFYECLNFASLRKLPILFICENNGLAIHTPIEKRWATTKLCERVETFAIPAQSINDGDVFAIRDAAGSAVAVIRDNRGPMFLECHTYRWRGHVGPDEDYDDGYRDRNELAPWIERDQVTRLAALLDSGDRAEIDRQIEDEIRAAIAFAEDSPTPQPDELLSHVFAD